MFDLALLGLCAIQVGVCEAATEQAAAYTSQREQFGKPLSTFQGVQLRAADAYIDTEAIRVTTMQAAWKLDAGLPAHADVLVAKWWAAEAGQHAVHNTQHLHGGMGADIDYPIHRYFLWGKQIEDTLGGAERDAGAPGQGPRGSMTMSTDTATLSPGIRYADVNVGDELPGPPHPAHAHVDRLDRDRVARLPGRAP